LHEDAKSDLRKLCVDDPKNGGRVLAFIQQLQADPFLIDKLTTHDFGPEAGFRANIKKILSFWNKGKDLWRLKISDVDKPYRIIYAYIPKSREIYILGVVHRSFDYDHNHPATQRILAAYDEISS